MSLRWKTVVIVIVTAAIVVGIGFAFSQVILMRSFQSIEDQDAKQAVEQVRSVLYSRIQSLHTLNHDWAAWDDTYNFVQHPAENQNYIEVNPTDTTFANAGLNLILIIDTNGNLVYGKAFDLKSNKEIPIPKSSGALFSNKLLSHISTNDSASGIVLLPEGPLLISSQPIITSQGDGPVMGTIIMAQFLDSQVIDSLSRTANLPISVVTVNDSSMPSEYKIALSSLSIDAPVLVRPLNSESIAGYGLLNDVYGNGVMVLKTYLPRDIYGIGTDTVRYLLIALLLMGVLISILLYLSVGRLVISRVSQIGNYVNAIGTSSDLTKRLSIAGNDELSRLGRNINEMVGTLQESKQALQVKQQIEEKLRLTIESVVEGIATTNLDGMIIDTNDSKVLLHGYSSKAELIGKNVLDLIAEEDRIKAQDELKRTLELGYPGGSEYAMLRKDGSKFFGERLAAVLKNPYGKPIGFVVSTKDITERKRAQDALAKLNEELMSLNSQLEARVEERTLQLERAMQEANAANKAKSDFLASMSHELRTPLNAIIGFSEMLREQYFGPLNDKQREYVSYVSDSGDHLLSLINDILDLSKIEAGKIELELGPVDIKDLLESSLVMIKEKAIAHSIKLTLRLSPECEGLRLQVDQRRVKQVMFNLLSNAAKFTPDGGAITVEARKDARELVVSVTDTGIGIPLASQSRIFEEFFQVKGGTTGKTPGTGLGLAITRRIVNLHCGRIWFASEGEGKGTTFFFTLPLELKEACLPEHE